MADKITTGTQTKDDNNIVTHKITNKFNKMIIETLEEQKKILTKRKLDLETWGENEKKEFEKIFGIKDEKARQWILLGVNRMLILNGELKATNFRPVDQNVHASVNKTQDKDFIIDIGKKFGNDKMRGRDSRVATLCHEMSHYGIILNTSDMTPSGNDPMKTSPKDFQSFADNLVKKHDAGVMMNAYNIERYFE
ncbi:type VI secretion system secreted protein VgrG [Rahnella inusitata]|nr:type VI secretion system secreted protein VgrG [Rahnella inusitata]